MFAEAERFLGSTFLSTCLGAHDLERATPILSLRKGVSTDQVIFSIILEQFSPRKWKFRSLYVGIYSTIVISKHQKYYFLGLPFLMTEF